MPLVRHRRRTGRRALHLGLPELEDRRRHALRIGRHEVDHYWDKLGEGGEHGPCGWLKDRFGLSWQVVPNRLPELLSDPDREKSQRVMAAMMEMGKIEIDELERAAAAA